MERLRAIRGLTIGVNAPFMSDVDRAASVIEKSSHRRNNRTLNFQTSPSNGFRAGF
jgi:hypothetical protein